MNTYLYQKQDKINLKLTIDKKSLKKSRII